MNTTHRQTMVEIAVVLAFCAFTFFYGLGSFGLVGADEPRYAQIAREMLARHDWVTPVLNGVAWLEKPVLYYWGAMVSYSVFGVHDWSARLPTACMSTLMVVAVYFFMRRFRPGSQLDSAVILSSLAASIGFARAASTDMPLAAMFTIGMLSWYAWYHTRRRHWLYGFYLWMALATLAKGPVAPFLAGLVIVVFAGIRREGKLILNTLAIGGVLLYLIVTLPWFVLVQHANPQFVRVFIFQHNLARYSSDMFRHHQPFWYYIPVLLVGLLPWAALATAAFVRAIRKLRTEPLDLFLLLWSALPVVFFSFSGSKLPGYVLPAIPPFALLLGTYLWRCVRDAEHPSMWLILVHSLLGGVLLAGALLTNYFVLKLKPTPTAIAIAVVAGLICFFIEFALVYGKGLSVLRYVTVIPVVIGLAFVVKFASRAIDVKDSSRPISVKLAQLRTGGSGVQIAVLDVPRQVEYGLNFYENQPISRYERGEIPAGDHIVVTRPSASAKILGYAKRNPLDLGSFAPQNLELYFVPAK